MFVRPSIRKAREGILFLAALWSELHLKTLIMLKLKYPYVYFSLALNRKLALFAENLITMLNTKYSMKILPTYNL